MQYLRDPIPCFRAQRNISESHFTFQGSMQHFAILYLLSWLHASFRDPIQCFRAPRNISRFHTMFQGLTQHFAIPYPISVLHATFCDLDTDESLVSILARIESPFHSLNLKYGISLVSDSVSVSYKDTLKPHTMQSQVLKKCP